jgi:hypothetical protein
MSKGRVKSGLEKETGMTKKDYQLIAEALKVVGIEEAAVYHMDGIEDDPGAWFWKLLSELITRFKADNSRFNETIFRAAAEPKFPTIEDAR